MFICSVRKSLWLAGSELCRWARRKSKRLCYLQGRPLGAAQHNSAVTPVTGVSLLCSIPVIPHAAHMMRWDFLVENIRLFLFFYTNIGTYLGWGFFSCSFVDAQKAEMLTCQLHLTVLLEKGSSFLPFLPYPGLVSSQQLHSMAPAVQFKSKFMNVC